jgi:hypothetical protein
MTISPKLKFCIQQKCSKIQLTDITGLYNSVSAPNAWSNTQVVGNILLSQIQSAKVSFSNTSGTQVALYTLKNTTGVNLYPTEASNSFDFALQDFSLADGIYDVTYAVGVIAPDTAVDFTDRVLITCAANNCISNLWKKYIESGKSEDQETALLAESLLAGAKSLFVCSKYTNIATITSTLTKICTLASSDCGCGCS